MYNKQHRHNIFYYFSYQTSAYVCYVCRSLFFIKHEYNNKRGAILLRHLVCLLNRKGEVQSQKARTKATGITHKPCWRWSFNTVVTK